MKIGIIGAGIIGRLLAIRLCSLKQNVILIDRHPNGQGGASYIAAGMLSPFSELSDSGMLIHQLGIESLEIWPNILSEVEEPVFFQKNGSLVIAHPADFAELIRFQSKINFILGNSKIQEVSMSEITYLEPSLNKNFNRGIYFPMEGQIDPQEFFLASQKFFLKNEVECLFNTDIETISSGTNYSRLNMTQFDWIIDCRGMGARSDLLDLRGVRGELILLDAPEVQLNRPIRLLHPNYPLYIVPRPQGRILIGATQIESEDTGPISVRSILELLTAAYTIETSFSEAQIVNTKTGIRPVFINHLPRIDVKGQMVRVNGLFRHGYLIGPKIAEIISHFILDYSVESKYTHLFQEGIFDANLC